MSSNYVLQHNTQIADLRPGNVIWAAVVISTRDIAHTRSDSVSTGMIKAGMPIGRFCIVLEPPSDGKVVVTYVSTFGRKTKKIANLSLMDKTLWCPVFPAPNEFGVEPLPAREGLAATTFQWISLRKTHSIESATVTLVTDFSFTEEEAEKIKEWIKVPGSAVVKK